MVQPGQVGNLVKAADMRQREAHVGERRRVVVHRPTALYLPESLFKQIAAGRGTRVGGRGAGQSAASVSKAPPVCASSMVM